MSKKTVTLTAFRNKHADHTCLDVSLVAHRAGAGLIHGEHANAVGLSTPQVAQIAVGQGVVALHAVAAVLGDAD